MRSLWCLGLIAAIAMLTPAAATAGEQCVCGFQTYSVFKVKSGPNCSTITPQLTQDLHNAADAHCLTMGFDDGHCTAGLFLNDCVPSGGGFQRSGALDYNCVVCFTIDDPN